MTKNHENLARRFGDNYLQDRIKPSRVRALRVCTGYHFL